MGRVSCGEGICRANVKLSQLLNYKWKLLIFYHPLRFLDYLLAGDEECVTQLCSSAHTQKKKAALASLEASCLTLSDCSEAGFFRVLSALPLPDDPS